MEGTRSNTLIVWRFLDGKPGHESQSLGLINALKRIRPVEAYDLPALPRFEALKKLFFGRIDIGGCLPRPHLIVGAGHSTHLSVLAAKRAYGGKTVLLMKPSLPASVFDLCLIPEHDGAKAGPNIVTTTGVLNTISRSSNQLQESALILVGGPSSHYTWDTVETVAKIMKVVQSDTQLQWTLTTSRRTPTDCEQALIAINESNLNVVPFAKTELGWVSKRLAECRTVWVTEDSVSMVYEALTSGAGVGLLPVPLKLGKQSRVSSGVTKLVEQKLVTTFADCESNFCLKTANGVLAEAERCAKIVVERLYL